MKIALIAPSCSALTSKRAKQQRTLATLQSRGFTVSQGKNIYQTHRFGTASVEARLEDLHNAYQDKSIDIILCITGGWLVNELLPGIDWGLVRDNPKPLIGFSDATVLTNAIYAKTGQLGLLGPSLGSIGERFAQDYTINTLAQVLEQNYPITLKPSKQWSPRNRKHYQTRWKVLQKGVGRGIAIGGNLGSFYLLQGTEYMPPFNQDTILCIEDDDEAGKYAAREFDRRLESILQQPGARKYIRGVMVGRFLPNAKVQLADIIDIVKRKKLGDIPVVANMDFGHTIPMFTIPIGGQISLDTQKGISCVLTGQ